MLVVVAGLLALVIYKAIQHGTPATGVAPTRAQGRVDQLSGAVGCPENSSTEPRKSSWRAAPHMFIDVSKTYSATVVTDVGAFSISLDAEEAPKSVNNFIFLANHGFFNCLTIFRAVPPQFFLDGRIVDLDAFVETGDPTGSGNGGPGYRYSEPSETLPMTPVVAGTAVMVEMAGSGRLPRYGSQFSVLMGTTSQHLPFALPDHDQPFGVVSSGMDVLEDISGDGNATPGRDGLPPRVVHRIFHVSISET